MSAPPPPIPNPRHRSGGADPKRPTIQLGKEGWGNVVVPFFGDEEMESILRALATVSA